MECWKEREREVKKETNNLEQKDKLAQNHKP